MTVQISDLDLINTLNDNAFIHIKDTDGFDRRMLASTFTAEVNAEVLGPLAAPDSTVLVGGVEAGVIAGQSHILAINYLPDGYVTDGSVDYTAQIQQAINDGAAQNRAVELPDFPVQTTVAVAFPGIGLTIPSNSVVFHKRNGQGELRLAPNENGNYRQVLIRDVSNVYIPFIRLRGDKFTHTGTGGEFGHVLVIDGACSQIVIDEAELYDAWGDGLYIGQKSTPDPDHPDRLQLGTIFIDNARRNGFSLISASNLHIKHLITNNTRSDNSSTPLPAGPHAGTDIEPNNGLAVLKNIQIDKVSGKNNEDGLFYVYLTAYAPDYTTTPGYVDITVGSVNDEGSLFAVRMAGLGNTGKVQGHITINNVAAKDTLSSAFVCQNWGYDVGLPVRIGTLSCANTGKGFAGNKFAAPVSIYQDSAGFGDIGNVSVNGLSIQRDDVGVSAIAYLTNAGGEIENVEVHPVSLNYGVAGSRLFGNGASGRVHWSLPDRAPLYVATFTGSGTITTANQGRYAVNAPAVNPTIDLPATTASLIGSEYEIEVISCLAYVDIRQNTGATIRAQFDNGVRYRMLAGDRVRLKMGADHYSVVAINGVFIKQA